MRKIIILLVALLPMVLSYGQKTRGNTYLLPESKTVHTLQLHVGYNAINNNNSEIVKEMKGFPLGLSYEYCKASQYYLKVKFTDFAKESQEQVLAFGNNNGRAEISETYSEYLVSLSFGLVNQSLYAHKFQIGIALGGMFSQDKVDQITYNPGMDTLINNTTSNKSNMFTGVELGYKYFLTNHLSIGLEGMLGYVFSKDKPAYSLTAVVGYSLFRSKNYRF